MGLENNTTERLAAPGAPHMALCEKHIGDPTCCAGEHQHTLALQVCLSLAGSRMPLSRESKQTVTGRVLEAAGGLGRGASRQDGVGLEDTGL